MRTSLSLALCGVLTLLLPCLPPARALSQERDPDPKRSFIEQAKARVKLRARGIELRPDMAYAEAGHPRQRLDVLLPMTRVGDAPLPVVVFIHGGAWLAGDQRGGHGPLAKLVETGRFAGVTVGYRLSQDAIWPAQLHDCKAAVRWIRAHAGELGLDASRIAALGPSAGGHLAAMLGVTGDEKELEGTVGPHLSESSRVTCVADWFGPAELLAMSAAPSRIDHDAPSSPESRLVGGPLQSLPDRARAASPTTWASRGDAPFLIVHGDADPLVPHDQSKRLAAALRRAEVPVTFITVEGGEHGGFDGPELDRRLTLFLRKHLLGEDVEVPASALRPGAPVETAGRIQTVRGPIPAEELGLALAHEHITTDFIGAERSGAPRYDQDRAVETVLPALRALAARGGKALFECTPAYIGRDVRLLRRLSEESGLHIVTNTGYYAAVGNRYLPAHAREETAEQLAARWLSEWRDGIDGTDVRPGFIKLGVDRGPLPELHQKLVRAAARVHLESGLTIAIHTGDGAAARDELRLLEEEGVAPEALIVVHAQNATDDEVEALARRGAWVSLDGYSPRAATAERYAALLGRLAQADLLGRVLVSHDDGWAVDGEAPSGAGLTPFGNGNDRPYTSVFTRLLPDLEERGLSKELTRRLLTANPRTAFTIRVRRLSAR